MRRSHAIGLAGGLVAAAGAALFVAVRNDSHEPVVSDPVRDAEMVDADLMADAIAPEPSRTSTHACELVLALAADAGVSVSAEVALSVPLAGACLPTHKGAWGGVVTHVVEPPKGGDPCDTSTEVSYAILHVDEVGHVVRVSRKATVSPCESDVVRAPAVSDLDGDGEDELIIPFDHYGPGGADEGPRHEVGKILAFRGGAIVDVTHGLRFHGAVDFDGDGRVDLVTFSPYEIMLHEGGCMPGDRAMPGPELVLHSLADGGFSRDDDVAKSFARTHCASRPAHLVLSQDGGLEQQETAVMNVACAKLWGVSEARVADQIAIECAKSDELGDALGQGDNGKSDCFTASHTEICLDGGIAWPAAPLRLDR